MKISFLEKLLLGVRWQMRWIAFRRQVLEAGWDASGWAVFRIAEGVAGLVILPLCLPILLLRYVIQPIINLFQLDEEQFEEVKEILARRRGKKTG